MKILPTPKHPQSSAGAVGDAGAQTGEPDVQVSLGPQDAEGAQGPGGRQEQGWVVKRCSRALGYLFLPQTCSKQTWPRCGVDRSLGAAVCSHGSCTHCQRSLPMSLGWSRSIGTLLTVIGIIKKNSCT